MKGSSTPKTPSQERFASLYFPDSNVLCSLKNEADKRRTSFNKLCIEVLTQVVAQMGSKRSKGVNAKTFKVVLKDRA